MKTETAQFKVEEALKETIEKAVPLPLARLGYGGLIWCSLEDVQSAHRCSKRRDPSGETTKLLDRVRREMKRLDVEYVVELPLTSLIWASTGRRWKP